MSGPTTPLPDKKLLLFILDRLQKCVFYLFLSIFFCFLFSFMFGNLSVLFFTVHDNHFVERTHMRYSLSLWIQKR